jgi:hypothetical protein
VTVKPAPPFLGGPRFSSQSVSPTIEPAKMAISKIASFNWCGTSVPFAICSLESFLQRYVPFV